MSVGNQTPSVRHYRKRFRCHVCGQILHKPTAFVAHLKKHAADAAARKEIER